jgi:hypothetical protein
MSVGGCCLVPSCTTYCVEERIISNTCDSCDSCFVRCNSNMPLGRGIQNRCWAMFMLEVCRQLMRAFVVWHHDSTWSDVRRGGAIVGGLAGVFYAAQLMHSIFKGERTYRDTMVGGMATGVAFGAFSAVPFLPHQPYICPIRHHYSRLQPYYESSRSMLPYAMSFRHYHQNPI